MKCEFASAFVELKNTEPRRLDLKGWYIDGKLTAKIINSDNINASVSTPELVPLGTGASGGFRFGADVTRSLTTTAVMDFYVSPSASSAAICDQTLPGVERVKGLGIYEWLTALNRTPVGEPTMAFSNLTYTLDFGLRRVGDGGVDVVVTPLKLSAEAESSRDDTQQLVMTISPGEPAQKSLKQQVAQGAVTGPTVFETPDGKSFSLFNLNVGRGLLGNDSTLQDVMDKNRLY